MKTVKMTPDLYDYVIKMSPPPLPVLEKVQRETAARKNAGMQIAPDQGAFMHMLVKLIGAKRILEVGCFTGYSALCMGSALTPQDKLYTLDVNPDTAAQARGYFKEAGLDDRIELLLGDGTKSLAYLLEKHGRGSFDLAFIDADKPNYPAYFEASVQLLRTGGLIIIDNALWSGNVIDYSDQSPDTVALRNFNDAALRDERVEKAFLHIADGLFLLRKK